MPRCRDKLRVVDANISVVKKAYDEGLKKLDERRIEIMKAINQIIDDQKENERSIEQKKLHL